MTYMVRIGGRSGLEIAQHSPVVYETLANGGLGDASWTFNLPSHAAPRGVKRGALVDVLLHGVRLWGGCIDEIDRETWGVKAISLWDMGSKILALDPSGESTRSAAQAAVTATIGRAAWPVSIAAAGGVVDGDSLEPMMVTDLLEQYAQQTGQRVGVEANPEPSGKPGVLYMRPDPTTPRWLAQASDLELSASDKNTANAFVGRYWDGSRHRTAQWYATSSGIAVYSDPIDLTEFGTLTLSQAHSILAQTAVLRAGRPTWTNGLTLHRTQITNLGGANPPLELVRGGDMVRFIGLSDSMQTEIGSPYLDAVLGRVVNTSGSDSIYVEPVGSQPMTLEEAMEQVVVA